MPQTRTFTETITIDAGTQAGIYQFDTVLDKQYDRASGFAAYINNGGGIPTFQLGLRDTANVYASPTNVAYFTASEACPKPARLTPVNIVCDNTKLSIQIVTPAQLTDTLVLDVIFQLEKA